MVWAASGKAEYIELFNITETVTLEIWGNADTNITGGGGEIPAGAVLLDEIDITSTVLSPYSSTFTAPFDIANISISLRHATDVYSGIMVDYFLMSLDDYGSSCDTDDDGIPDHLDTDADGDGCFDVLEARFTDADNNGQVDGTGYDTNGLVTGGDGYGIPIDTDNSGTADYLEAAVFGSNASYIVNGGYDIASATVTQYFSVADQETTPQDITFNNDGTKLFVIGSNSDKINVYSLTTAYDVSTATFTTGLDFSVAGQETQPSGMAFNTDGTKMYIIGYVEDYVNEYHLTSAFAVYTATYVQRFSTAAEENSPRGMTFNNDGSKMYVIGSDGDDVNEYHLSTGFDISTASYAQNFSVSNEENNPQGVGFNHDGSKMFIVGLTSDAVYQYNLTTGFDISTATYAQTISVDDAAPMGLVFNHNGTKLFVVGYDGDSVYEYSLNNPAEKTVAINSAITNITFNTTGTSGIGTATGLPNGVTASWSNNVLTISGTPTEFGTFNYTIPLLVECGGSSNEGLVVSGTLNVEADTDGDGIIDSTDVDDDNDGILDIDEGCGGVVVGSFDDYQLINTTTTSQDFTTTEGSTVTVTLSSPTNVYEEFQSYNPQGYKISSGSHVNESEALTLTFSKPITEVKISVSSLTHNLLQNPSNGGNEVFKLKVNNSYHRFDANNFIATYQNPSIDGILGKHIIGSTGGAGNFNYVLSEATGIKTLTLEVDVLEATPRGIEAKIEFIGDILKESAANCQGQDTDNDGTPDHLGTDADGDGCLDAIEAGFTDADFNGQVDGTGVDANGRVTGSDGYGVPADTNNSGTADYLEPSVSECLAITDGDSSVSVPENQTAVDSYSANEDIVTWTLSGPDSALFSINS